VNQLVSVLIDLYSIDHRLITTYNPRANSVVEVQNRVILSAIRKLLHDDTAAWDLCVQFVQVCINSKISSITGSTPYALMFNCQINEFRDYANATATDADYDDWQQRHRQLIDLIYPAIAECLRNKAATVAQQFAMSHKIIDADFPPGTFVMACNDD
jgi:hypothetical protein